MNWLLAPFHFAFMRAGFEAVILVGITCGLLGCYVVLRRMAFIGDAISHTVLPGIVVAYLRGYNLFFGALISGLLTALGIGWLSSKDAVREDTAIGVLFTFMFSLGILLISTTRSFIDFSGILFGHITSVTPAGLLVMLLIAVIVLATLILFYKELELTSVDPSYSAVVGLRADWMRNVLLVLLALAVVTAIQAVGVILTIGLLVTPAAAASLLTRHLVSMMILSVVIAVLSGVIGLFVTFYINANSGAAIVITCTMFFAVAFCIHLARRPRQKSTAPATVA
jgi:ABC-type Mn2+/Zn2+ transport system permease subunit